MLLSRGERLPPWGTQNPYPPYTGTLALDDPLSDNSRGYGVDSLMDSKSQILLFPLLHCDEQKIRFSLSPQQSRRRTCLCALASAFLLVGIESPDPENSRRSIWRPDLYRRILASRSNRRTVVYIDCLLPFCSCINIPTVPYFDEFLEL